MIWYIISSNVWYIDRAKVKEVRFPQYWDFLFQTQFEDLELYGWYAKTRDLLITSNNSDCIFFRDLQKC
jgi:hypothetical protein